MDGKEVAGGPGDYMHINTRSHGAMYHESQLHSQAQNGLEMDEYKKEKNSHIHERNHDMQKTTAKTKRAKALSTKDQEDINLCAQLLNEVINQMNKSRSILTPVATDYEHNKSKIEPADNKASKKGQNKSKKEPSQRNAMNNPARGNNVADNRNSRDTRRATNQKHMIENQNSWGLVQQGVDMIHPIQVGYFSYAEEYVNNPAYMHEFQNHHMFYHPQPQPVGLFNCPRSARHVGIANYIWRHIGNQEKDPTEFARMIKKKLYDKNRRQSEGQEYEQMQMYEQQQVNPADYQSQNAAYQQMLQMESLRYHQGYYDQESMGMNAHMMNPVYYSQYNQFMQQHQFRPGEMHAEQMEVQHQNPPLVEEPPMPQAVEQPQPPEAPPEATQMLVEPEELEQQAKPPTN